VQDLIRVLKAETGEVPFEQHVRQLIRLISHESGNVRAQSLVQLKEYLSSRRAEWEGRAIEGKVRGSSAHAEMIVCNNLDYHYQN